MFDYFRSFSSNVHHVCCEDSPTKGLCEDCQSDDPDFIQGHTCVSNFTSLLFNLQYLKQYLSYYIHTWHDGRHMDVRYVHARFDDLGLDATSQCVGKGITSALRALGN